MNNLIACEDSDFKPEMFNSFKMVLSGHFHIRSQKSLGDTNFCYLGSVFQMNFGDGGDSRGFYVFDDETYMLDFYSYEGAPKFIKISIEDEIDPKEIEGNIIKISWTKDYGTTENNKLLDQIYSYKPLSISSNFSLILENEDLVLEENIQLLGAKDILMLYIEIMICLQH